MRVRTSETLNLLFSFVLAFVPAFFGCGGGDPIVCIDADGDGYGNPGSANCTYSGTDCDDGDADVHPGAGCPGACTDADGDGYGNPGSAACAHPQTDCDDSNDQVNPGVTEGPYKDPVCSDTLDNDCDGSADGADTGCRQCSLPAQCNDANPCTDDTCVGGSCVNTNNSAPCNDDDPCTENDVCSGGVCSGAPLDADNDGYVSDDCDGNDCDDSNDQVNPGVTEGPFGDPVCGDTLDNDCDGFADGADTGCQECSLPAQCNDDNPCTNDNCVGGSCVNTNNSAPCNDGDPCTENDVCSAGTCSGDPLDADNDTYVSDDCGGNDCDDSNAQVNPGVTEEAYGDPICGDGLDNDCDGFADGADTGCQECSFPADCNDANPCTNDACVAGFCENTNNSAPCNDGDGCTQNDTCSNGTCSGDPLDADNDGYVSDACVGGNDCDDSNDQVNPGVTEGPSGDPVCSDTLDNDCDGDTDLADSECLTPGMALIPEGCFLMGDTFAEGSANELPVHNVCISAFQMDVHEVTNAEYEACVSDGDCTDPSNLSSLTRPTYYGDPAYDDFPVIYVDRFQAEDYCTWAGKRLPTEAEWEYAARGGLAGNRYPWGDTISGTDANYFASGDPWEPDTSQVEYYAPNGFGLYDMAGNVWEWVNDWYDPGYYQYCVDNEIVNDPPGPASGAYRILRGGAWGSATSDLRVAFRFNSNNVSDSGIGFRCAE